MDRFVEDVLAFVGRSQELIRIVEGGSVGVRHARPLVQHTCWEPISRVCVVARPRLSG